MVRQDQVRRAQEETANADRRMFTREQRLIHHEVAAKFDRTSCPYLFNQSCGIWNVECHQGCGYIHLSSSTPTSMRKKCCIYGLLSELSPNFDQDTMLRFALDQLPAFMKNGLYSREFDQQSTKYTTYLQWQLPSRYAIILAKAYLQDQCVTLSG